MTTRLLEELALLLEVKVEELHADAELDSFSNWDSLSKVSVIGILIDSYGASVDLEAFEDIKTVGQLCALAQQKAVPALQ